MQTGREWWIWWRYHQQHGYAYDLGFSESSAGHRYGDERSDHKCAEPIEDVMPARSKKQQMAAGAALAAKRHRRSNRSLFGASRRMYESMSGSKLEDLAKTKRRKLPRKTKSRRA
jgi:hypothetical protein